MVIELTVTIELEEDSGDPEQALNPERMTELLSEMEDLTAMKGYNIYSTNWEII